MKMHAINKPTHMCHAEKCWKPMKVQTPKGNRFCPAHYHAWSDEVLAAGGTTDDVKPTAVLCCVKCETPQMEGLESNFQCYDCNMAENNPSWITAAPSHIDPVNHPQHYTHPSGVECITVTEHMNFCLGNAMKYLWRADRKNGLEDLKKARWYIEREIARREK